MELRQCDHVFDAEILHSRRYNWKSAVPVKTEFKESFLSNRSGPIINYSALIPDLCVKLEEAGIKFSGDGYPLIPSQMLLKDVSSGIEMYPISHRHQATNKRNTILCWYENDKLLHRHINRLDDLLKEFRDYYAVTGVDLSPCVNANLVQQKSAILLSQLLTAYMAVNGINILANFRTGGFETVNSLSGYPFGIPYAVGTLGCARQKTLHGLELMRAKLFVTCPKKLVIYGSVDKQFHALLEGFAIPFAVIPDFKTRCFQARKEANHVW